MVSVLEDQDAVMPEGRFDGEPIPVAPVVLCVIGVRSVLIHSVGEVDAGEAVLSGLTVIVPVALTVLQDPFKGTVYVKVPD